VQIFALISLKLYFKVVLLLINRCMVNAMYQYYPASPLWEEDYEKTHLLAPKYSITPSKHMDFSALAKLLYTLFSQHPLNLNLHY
jgi:hypothetical protein